MSCLGKLYIVATPIGNLGDITARAITVLSEVQWIAAEDTRQSKKLLEHYAITTPLFSLHAHNERAKSDKIINLLSKQQNVAYITDAGTPSISDPGAYLVRAVRNSGYGVSPLPGPCAAIAALSVSGLNTLHFYFEGFLPSKSGQRQQRLLALRAMACTLIFYEAPHRLLATLSDMERILGDREAVITRELTKKFETIETGTLQGLQAHLTQASQTLRGEFVILVSGNKEVTLPREKIMVTLETLLQELPLKQTVSLASRLLDVGKNELYALALELKNKS